MDVQALLEQIRVEIDADTRALEKKKEFYEFLVQRADLREEEPRPSALAMRIKEAVASTNTAGASAALTSAQAFEDGLPNRAALRRGAIIYRTSGENTFRRTVERHVRIHGRDEFSMNDVYEGLRARGEMVEPDRKSVITTILSRMADAGELERTAVGSGSAPNKYRLKGHTASLPLDKETSNQ